MRRWARAGSIPPDPVPVQLRFETGLTGDEYVTRELWRSAALAHCPLHPEGGCGLAGHGLYERKTPAGTFIARWYCPRGHCTFSLLPDHLAARFPGTLAEIERVVDAADTRAASLQACADALRPDPVSLPSATRWLRRSRCSAWLSPCWGCQRQRPTALLRCVSSCACRRCNCACSSGCAHCCSRTCRCWPGLSASATAAAVPSVIRPSNNGWGLTEALGHSRLRTLFTDGVCMP